jgi:hypothetical protein
MSKQNKYIYSYLQRLKCLLGKKKLRINPFTGKDSPMPSRVCKIKVDGPTFLAT